MSDRFKTQEDVFRFLDIVESKGVGNLIPFPDDLLFHFFNKKTEITDTYLLDPVSQLKLYPRKSNNIVTTSVNTQFQTPVAYYDYAQGFVIEMSVYYDPATHDLSKANWICGRGNNTGFHSGISTPGTTVGDYFEGRWRLQNTGSRISSSGLTADWYRVIFTVTATTFKLQLKNLRTNVTLDGSEVNIGTVSTADLFDFTFLCYGINGTTGAYGSVGLNISDIKVHRGTTCLLNIPLSSGTSDKVVDICNKVRYTLAFFTTESGWAKLSDYCHANFFYGYTLYQKAGSPDLRICNAEDFSEITITPPSGYTRIANYKSCKNAFNQCESKFKLDDADAGVETLIGAFGQGFWAGTMPETVEFTKNGTLNGKDVWQSADGDLIRWEDNGGLAWCIRSHLYLPGIQCYSYDDVANPSLATTWVGRGGSDYISFELQTSDASDLFTADIDRVLFDVDGVAKEITIQDIYSEIVGLTHDRGHLYINSDSNKNMMLYKTNKGVDTPEDLKIWAYVEK